MDRKSLAAEIFKGLINTAALLSKGLPEERYFETLAQGAWRAAAAFERAEPNGEPSK